MLAQGLDLLKSSTAPFVIVATGQSNMLGANNDLSGDATTINENVKAWKDGVGWITSQPGVFPPYGNTFANTNNLAHWFGLRVHEETGRPVYIILRAKGSMTVDKWLASAGPEMDQFGNLHLKCTLAFATPELAGLSKADVVLWQQGESDHDHEYEFYRSTFYQVYDRFTSAPWFDKSRPFICGELPHNTIHAVQNALHSNHHKMGRRSIITASSAGLLVDDTNAHYTGASLQELGYNRFFSAYLSYLRDPLPYNAEAPYNGAIVPCTENFTLPSCVAPGFTLTPKNVGTSPVFVAAPAGGTIDGEPTLYLPIQNDAATLVSCDSDGKTWLVKEDSRHCRQKIGTIKSGETASIVAPAKCGKISITVNPFANSPNLQFQALLGYDVGSTPNLAKWIGGTGVDAVAGDVAGVDSPSKLTVGVVAGALKVKNQTGADISLAYSFTA